MVLVHDEDQSRDAALRGAIVFHLGDRDGMALGYASISMRQDSKVNVGLVHHPQRYCDGIIIAGRQMLHHQRKALADTSVHHLFPMLRQIARRATDHDLLAHLVKPTSYLLSSFASTFELPVSGRSSTIARLSFARS
jgi:hypothetical protein